VSPDLPTLVFRPVTAARWDDLARLFEARGGPKSCWCMVWRATPAEARRTDGRSRKAALRLRVEQDLPIGILGYAGREPVAWCSIAPRTTFRRLCGLDDPADDPARIWSLVCMFVPRALRGRGVTRRLIEAAVAEARRRGATVVEAYPVDADSPSYRFMGRTSTFAALGFEEVGRAGSRRHVMRLRLDRRTR
jgi:GNAT superfamily N-acetyltransferase